MALGPYDERLLCYARTRGAQAQAERARELREKWFTPSGPETNK
jgi:hypothetical protein